VKFRDGFVSNSSSSSFIVLANEDQLAFLKRMCKAETEFGSSVHELEESEYDLGEESKKKIVDGKARGLTAYDFSTDQHISVLLNFMMREMKIDILQEIY